MFTPIAIVLLTAGVLGSTTSFITNEPESAKLAQTVVVTEPAPDNQPRTSAFLDE
jgi:hypothetical protein